MIEISIDRFTVDTVNKESCLIAEVGISESAGSIFKDWGAIEISFVNSLNTKLGVVKEFLICDQIGRWYIGRSIEFHDPSRRARVFLWESDTIEAITSEEAREGLTEDFYNRVHDRLVWFAPFTHDVRAKPDTEPEYVAPSPQPRSEPTGIAPALDRILEPAKKDVPRIVGLHDANDRDD
jgi:hypothetical protein